MLQLSDTTAETIHKSLKCSLVSLGFQFENCKGQAYDGASNFQGHISEVGKRFQSENPAAIPIHCLAHCVNLCLQEVARKVTCIKEGLNFAMEVIQLIKFPQSDKLFLKVYRISKIHLIPQSAHYALQGALQGGRFEQELCKLLLQTMKSYNQQWKYHLME